MIENLGNWAGNYSYRASRILHPETVEEVQKLVVRSSKLKALGTRHSFNDIADTPGDLISLEHLDQIVALDRERSVVTVQAGVRYGRLARWLHREGYALHNLASLPHISVAGACATATHGSGDRNGNLATAASELELVRADGERVTLSRERNSAEFDGAVVGLGGLGIITELTLDVSPAFQMQQDVYQDLPLKQLEGHFEELFSSAYGISLFTDWRNGTFNQVWLKRVVPDGSALETEPSLFTAKLATRNLHPIATLSAENCTEQMGIPGPWFERLPHFRMDFTPSSGEELQSEYILPREHTVAAFHAIDQIKDRVIPLLQISEVRSIAADSLWMSPSYKRAGVAIHFTWKKDWDGVRELLPAIEEKLAPFEARPHWGKLFTISPTHLQSLYERLPDFRRLLQEYDPGGKFRNWFLDRFIFGVP